MQQLLLHTKGLDRMVLVTDSTVYDNPVPEHYAHVTDLNFDHNGHNAGSKLTMDQACRNIMTHTNCGIAQAFLMASRNPARVIGLDHEIGTIEAGKLANLVFVDDVFNVKKVMLGGKIWQT
jgi:N-acetylglucosamine-6-phosphate deacetylase